MATSTLRKRPPRPDDDPSSPGFTLVEHLDELRWRLAVCLITLIATAGLTLCYAETLIAWLRRPVGLWPPRLAYFSPTEALGAYVTVGFWGGVVLALPVILYQAWMFVRPALTWRERSAVVAWLGWGSALFLAGAAAAYWLVLPPLLEFLLRIGGGTLEPVLSVKQYLSFVLSVIISCGVVCELPLAIALLTNLDIVTPQGLRRFRPLSLLMMVVAAALLTPTTDAFTLLLAMVPLAALYEISIAVSRLVWQRRSRA